MNWIFPIAGFGTRTKGLGEYKPFIEIDPGLSIIKVCLTGLRSMFKDGDTFTFISTKQHEVKYNVTNKIFSIMSDIKPEQVFCSFVGRCDTKVYLLDETPPGQALTLLQGLSPHKQMWPDEVVNRPTIVVNPDQFVMFDISTIKQDIPAVGVYFNNGDNSCFFDIDLFSTKVNEIKEKEKISSYASSGIFYFPNINVLLKAVRWGIENNVVTNGELYLSSCLNYFSEIHYFKTDIKFDLGNFDNIKRFKDFWGGLKQ